jgi:replicative DNA helicase
MLTSVQRFVAAAIQSGKIDGLLKHGPVGHLFTGEEEKLWKYVDAHVKKYGVLPDYQLLRNETGFDLCDQPQPPEFYLDKAKELHIQQTLVKMFDDTKSKHLMGGMGMKPTEGLQSIAQAVMKLTTQQMGASVIDYRQAVDMIMAAFVAKAQGNQSMGLRLGWPTLDKMTDGLSVGDLISFVARPAAGKTWMMLFMALAAWEQGKVPLFVSMEIKPLPIMQRLLAIQANIPAKGIREAYLTTEQSKLMKQAMKKTKEGELPFHIVDGNLATTVGDIHALCRQLKPDAVWIDGAYLLKHPTERDRYKRVAENCDLIKQRICDLAPTVCSWQFARPPKSKKKPETPEAQTLDDIAYSDAIGQHSSLICGLKQPDSVETANERTINILKGRNGETGSFNVRWDFEWATDFSEIESIVTTQGEEVDLVD